MFSFLWSICRKAALIFIIFLDGQISGVRHEKGKRLWFNISDALLTEEIIGAELRIYQDGNFAKKHKHYRDFTVTVFQLTQSDEGYVCSFLNK